MAEPGGIAEAFNNLFAKVKEGITAGAGKLGIEVSSTVPHAAGTSFASVMEGLLSPVVLGGFVAVSAVVNQMEYNHARHKITKFYDEELGAKLHKSTQQVGVGDLAKLENGDHARGLESNNTIKEAVNNERWKRNIGIGASFVASIAVFTLMHLMVPGAGLVPLLAKATVGVLSYMAIKAPIASTVNYMLGLNKETTHDKIVAIAKDRAQGKSITREQVAEVFFSGNKLLGEYVKDHFGTKYDDLPLADKVTVAKQLATLVPLETITQNINAGVTNASELAFTVEGQISGVLPKNPEKRVHVSVLSTFGQKCKALAHSISGHFHKTDERANNPAGFSEVPQAPASIQRHEESQAATNFAGRFAKDKSVEQGYVERLAQARAANITAPSTQTIQ